MKNYIMIDGRKIPLSEETANSLRKEYERIPCPINMNGVLDGIPFNNSKQVLSFEDGVYHVMGTTSFTENTHKLKCDLIPCRREDLNAGDTAFRSDSKDPDFKALGLYCIILNEREHVFAYSGDVIVSDGPFKYWWKVVPR